MVEDRSPIEFPIHRPCSAITSNTNRFHTFPPFLFEFQWFVIALRWLDGKKREKLLPGDFDKAGLVKAVQGAIGDKNIEMGGFLHFFHAGINDPVFAGVGVATIEDTVAVKQIFRVGRFVPKNFPAILCAFIGIKMGSEHDPNQAGTEKRHRQKREQLRFDLQVFPSSENLRVRFKCQVNRKNQHDCIRYDQPGEGFLVVEDISPIEFPIHCPSLAAVGNTNGFHTFPPFLFEFHGFVLLS